MPGPAAVCTVVRTPCTCDGVRVLEVDDVSLLPPYPWMVRRGGPVHGGQVVATYRSPYDARAHALPLEDARVMAERMAIGMPPHHRLWQIEQETRGRHRATVEALAQRWLDGCNRY